LDTRAIVLAVLSNLTQSTIEKSPVMSSPVCEPSAMLRYSSLPASKSALLAPSCLSTDEPTVLLSTSVLALGV